MVDIIMKHLIYHLPTEIHWLYSRRGTNSYSVNKAILG